MARKVKCQICKASGDTSTFYKVTDPSGKNKYYCSEYEYSQQQLKKEQRLSALKYIAEEILEYKDGEIIPPNMVKQLEQLAKVYTYPVIQETFKLKRDDIHYWYSVKDFETDSGKCQYTLAIIKGSINDVKRKYDEQQKIEKKLETKVDDDLNYQFEIPTEQPKTTSKNNSILDFLEDGDM